jgi:hypothetical protein
MMHGRGTYKWLDGRMYHGDYAYDKKHGFGVYVWADGRAYVGDWVEGKQADERVYILPNGNVRKGLWENGERKSWVDVTPEDQDTYKTHLNNALRMADEVEYRRREAEEYFQRLKSGHDDQQVQHEQEQLPEDSQMVEKL